MIIRAIRRSAVLAMLITLAGGVMFGDPAPAVDRPGALGCGVTLLPNGWKIAPAGWHVQIGDLPLAMAESPDGRYLLVSNNGYAKPSVTVFDEERGTVVQRLVLDHAWLGMAWHPDGKRLYVSGAGNNTVHELSFAGGRLTRGADLVLGRPMDAPAGGANRPEPVPQSFIGGVAVSHDRGATWEARNGGLFDDVHVVLADGPLLYATTGMGCFVSLDEGWRWSWASDGIDRGYTLGLAWTDDAAVVSAASGPPSLWEAGGPEAAIYRSSSRGREPRWERVFDAFGGAVERNCLQARDALVVAGTTDGELLISRDAGRTFSVGRSDLPAVNAVALAG